MIYKDDNEFFDAVEPLSDIIIGVGISQNMTSSGNKSIRTNTIFSNLRFDNDFGITLGYSIRTRMNILDGIRYPQKHFLEFFLNGPTSIVNIFTPNMPKYSFETENDTITHEEKERLLVEFTDYLKKMIPYIDSAITKYASENIDEDPTLIQYLPKDVQDIFIF